MTSTEATPPRGSFLTLEGPEGGGKSSVGVRLADALSAAGHTVTFVREPGGTSVGEAIRGILLDQPGAAIAPRVEALLFNAARAQLVVERIRPALERGEVVVCDRFSDSTLAYQGHAGGLPLDELLALERISTAGVRPDLTILLDLPAEVGLARKVGAQTRFETHYGVDYHRRVRRGFQELAAAEPGRFVIVDADRPSSEVLDDVVAAAHRFLEARVPNRSARSEPNAGQRRMQG